MALDTRNKRAGAIGLGLPFGRVLPNPDGSFVAADRVHLLYLYPGIVPVPPLLVDVTAAVFFWTVGTATVRSRLPVDRGQFVFDVGNVVPYEYDPADSDMAQVPLTASSAYCTVAEMLKRMDKRTVADLVSDTGAAVDSSALTTNAELLAAMLDASGEVESAAMHGGRYRPVDLQALTGASKARLCRMLVRLTICYLYERRPDKGPIPETYKAVQDDLKLLRDGEMVFGTVETFAAQSMDHEVETSRRVEDRDGTSFQSRRFFGRRSNRADGSE